MAQAPQHPGSQQQGLGAPTNASVPNPYVKPNDALNAYNADLNGARDAELQQANREGAIQGAQAGLQIGLEQPQVLPQQVQAQQLSDGINSGQVDSNTLQQMVQAGEVSQEVAQAAIGMAQANEAQAVQQYEQQQGLGPIQQGL